MKLLFGMNDKNKMEYIGVIPENSKVKVVNYENEFVSVTYDGTETISELEALITQAYYNCFFSRFEKMWSESTQKARNHAGLEYGISGDMSYQDIVYAIGLNYPILWRIYQDL